MERRIRKQTRLGLFCEALLLCSVSVALLLAGCGEQNVVGADPIALAGEWVGHGGCVSRTGEGGAVQTPSNLDCLKWEYDGEGVLTITHANAGFNCVPVIEASILMRPSGSGHIAGTIEIVEDEIEDGAADCLCLLELDYTLSDLPRGTYLVKVWEEEDYLQPVYEPLTFWLPLGPADADSFCVTREHYPWDEAP